MACPVPHDQSESIVMDVLITLSYIYIRTMMKDYLRVVLSMIGAFESLNFGIIEDSGIRRSDV